MSTERIELFPTGNTAGWPVFRWVACRRSSLLFIKQENSRTSALSAVPSSVASTWEARTNSIQKPPSTEHLPTHRHSISASSFFGSESEQKKLNSEQISKEPQTRFEEPASTSST